MLTPQRQVELLEQLFHTEAWTEFIEPSFKSMSEALYQQAKAEKDPQAVAKILGQSIGVDIVLQLPQLHEVLKMQLDEQKMEETAFPPALSLVD